MATTRTITTIRQILAELEGVLSKVNEAELDQFCEAILNAHTIVTFAMGRENLALRAFAMRLMHLGLNVAVTGDVTTPPAGRGDLFVVVCGPGYLATTQALMGIAHQAGARIAMITAQPQAELPRQADLVVTIPAQTLADAEQSGTTQAMGSAFEQALWILLDALVPRLQEALGQSADDMRQRHTNLE